MAKFRKYIRAQTAMELAVFGAILIFVVGAIVRQALSAGYMQNQQLRAMRQAMSTSYRYSAGLLGGGADGRSSHQTAQILFIEDRLTVESAKYGAIERTPFVVGASGMYSRNLFRPVTAIVEQNLPIYDVFINGKHFPFSTARFRTVELARPCSGVLPANCASYPECKGSCGAGSFQFYPPSEIYAGGPPVEWEDNCLTIGILCSDDCNPLFCNAGAGECVPYDPFTGTGSTKTWPGGVVGCAKLYDVIYNHPSYLEWCDDEPGGTSCPGPGNPGYNFTADERFDLDRSGPPGAPDPDVPGALGTARGDFFWQWYLVAGYDATDDRPGVTLNRGAGIVMEPSSCKKECKPSQHTVIDVDGDLKRERMMADSKQVDEGTGVMKSLVVMDMQDGDLDFTRGDSDLGPNPGLTRDARMYARTTDGTYLLVEEGKLYTADGDAGQYIRTTSKKDQIDLVERTIQLSNDTDRFCDSGGQVNNDPVLWPAGLPNPVEACSSDCHSGANAVKTCMDEDPAGDGTQPPVIYVRSRIVDQRGRKWITSTSGDDYVDFTLPAGP